MLTYLETWIKNIVVIILLTSFVELLLPRSRLEKYTRVVLGLFIVIAILNPILNLFNTNYNFRQITDLLTAQESRGPQISDIMKAGKKLKNSNRQKAKNDYKERIASQVEAILSFDEDLPRATVDVNLQANNQIKNIIVKFEKEQKEEKNSAEIKQVKVSKVEVGGEKEGTNERYNQKRESASQLKFNKKIKKRLANFYGLNPGEVLIQTD